MGWNTANDVFDPICEEVIRQTEKSDGLYPSDAISLLTVIIHEFQESDWDTEDESLRRFREYDYVVKAFANNDITLEEDENEQADFGS